MSTYRGPALLLLLPSLAWGAQVPPKETPAAPGRVRLSGDLERRLELSYTYLLSKRAIARDTGWGADQYARWLEAVGLLGNYLGRSSLEFDHVLDGFLGLQRPDGRILLPTLERRQWWGGARAVDGLMHLYAIRLDPRLLTAAGRLADFFVVKAPVETSTNTLLHGDYHSVLEGMVALWRANGDRKYLDFAQRVAAIIDPEVAPPGLRKLAHRPITDLLKGYAPHQHHTHSYLEIMQGIVDLYAATGKPEYLAMAEHVWAETLRHTMWVSGGIPEVYGEYFEHNDETCPVTSWILLNLKLFRESGDSKYMDVVEHALFNHLSFNQSVQRAASMRIARFAYANACARTTAARWRTPAAPCTARAEFTKSSPGFTALTAAAFVSICSWMRPPTSPAACCSG